LDTIIEESKESQAPAEVSEAKVADVSKKQTEEMVRPHIFGICNQKG